MPFFGPHQQKRETANWEDGLFAAHHQFERTMVACFSDSESICIWRTGEICCLLLFRFKKNGKSGLRCCCFGPLRYGAMRRWLFFYWWANQRTADATSWGKKNNNQTPTARTIVKSPKKEEPNKESARTVLFFFFARSKGSG